MAVVLVLLALRREQTPRFLQSPAPPATVATPVNAPLPAPAPEVQRRPFAVARESGSLQWTAEDGKDANVIRRLAHNDLEVQRMNEENARIIRRQLVYRAETAAMLVQQSKLTGEPVRQLTLPGLDGQLVQFEVERADLSPSGQQGTFTGYVAGKPDSMVTLAFKGGREAFTINSPSDNLYLQGEPREPGEVIVKSFDPDKYITAVCGNP